MRPFSPSAHSQGPPPAISHWRKRGLRRRYVILFQSHLWPHVLPSLLHLHEMALIEPLEHACVIVKMHFRCISVLSWHEYCACNLGCSFPLPSPVFYDPGDCRQWFHHPKRPHGIPQSWVSPTPPTGDRQPGLPSFHTHPHVDPPHACKLLCSKCPGVGLGS